VGAPVVNKSERIKRARPVLFHSEQFHNETVDRMHGPYCLILVVPAQTVDATPR
jgi:hypothetical protein